MKWLPSSSYQGDVSPSLRSGLALPFTSAQQNTPEAVSQSCHIEALIDLVLLILIYFYYGVKWKFWKMCFNKSVGFRLPLPDLRMFSTLQDEPGHCLVKSLPPISLIKGKGLQPPTGSCMSCTAASPLGFLGAQLLEFLPQPLCSIHTGLCSFLTLLGTYFCQGAFMWAMSLLIRNLICR